MSQIHLHFFFDQVASLEIESMTNSSKYLHTHTHTHVTLPSKTFRSSKMERHLISRFIFYKNLLENGGHFRLPRHIPRINMWKMIPGICAFNQGPQKQTSLGPHFRKWHVWSLQLWKVAIHHAAQSLMTNKKDAFDSSSLMQLFV